MGTFRLGLALVLTVSLAAPLASASFPWPGEQPIGVADPILRQVYLPDPGNTVKSRTPCDNDPLNCIYQDCVVLREIPACEDDLSKAAWEIVCLTPDQGVGLNLEGPGSGCQPLSSYVPAPPSLPP